VQKKRQQPTVRNNSKKIIRNPGPGKRNGEGKKVPESGNEVPPAVKKGGKKKKMLERKK